LNELSSSIFYKLLGWHIKDKNKSTAGLISGGSSLGNKILGLIKVVILPWRWKMCLALHSNIYKTCCSKLRDRHHLDAGLLIV
jgi:hypothetical protein